MCHVLASDQVQQNEQSFFKKAVNTVFPENRMTGRRSLRLIPKSFMDALGNAHFRLDCSWTQHVQLKEKYPFVSDIFDQLVKEAKAKYDPKNNDQWEIRIQNSHVINAYCLPGGKITITTGILDKLEKEAKETRTPIEDLAAAVLGHEISHALAEHGRLKVQINLIAHLIIKVVAWFFSWAIVPDPIVPCDKNRTPEKQKKVEKKAKKKAALQRNNVYRAIQWPLKFATFYLLSKHSKSCEFEADRYGIAIMHRAGYDPQAAVALQKMFLKMEIERSWLEKIFALDAFSSHPPSAERIKYNQQTISELPN